MSTNVRVGNRQLTAELICQHVSRSSLLPQLLREMILDRVLAQWEPSSTAELADGRAAFEQCYQQLAGLTHSRNLSQAQLTKIAERTVKLHQFKQGIWGGKLGSYFLERKSHLDRVVFSVMQLDNGSIAQELYFQIQAGEAPFAELALKYSQGVEAQVGGKVGPISIANLHPDMARQIGLLQPGQVSPLFIINNAYIFVQLEETLPAQFDDNLRQSLLDELFEKWLQAQISSEIGLISLETDFIPPDFMTNSQRVIVAEQTTNGLKLLFPAAPNANETPVNLQSESTGLEHGNPGLLKSQLGAISNPPVVELERATAPAIEPNSPPDQFVLERGDTGLLLAQLGDIASPPATSATDAAPAIEPNSSPEPFVLERGDTGLLLAQLGDIASPPATSATDAAPAIEPTSPPEPFVLERGDTGLLLAQLGDIASPPTKTVEKPEKPSSFNTTSGFFLATEAAPITYISDLDREFDTHKWLAILAIVVTTLALSLGSFCQLRSTGLSNTPLQQQAK
jgi:PPIC-type PPIASE domain